MSVDIRCNVSIPTRDGTLLSASIYSQRGRQTPAPCILSLTPYTADTYHDFATYFAANGYPFAIVDARGRGNSGGSFRPLLQEAIDGPDAVEWLAAQPFCNGKVGMWGGSYGGYVQWATAKSGPPHLATIVPAASPYPGLDFPMRRNIFPSFLIRWLTFTAGYASQMRLFADDNFWSAHYRDWYASGRPFCELDEMLCGSRSSIFKEWLSHPQLDAYWDAYNPTADEYARLKIPTLTITGIYDDDQTGALEHYRHCIHNAPPGMQERHFLIIGPWDHAGTRIPQEELGGVTFGPDSLVDLKRLHFEWYRWTLEGGAKPGFLRNQVAVYLTGAERWAFASTIEKLTATVIPLFLDSSQNAAGSKSHGRLSTTPGRGQPDAYCFDPRKLGDAELRGEARANSSLVDQTLLFALNERQLVYHSAPFDHDSEITGFFQLSAWIAIDCPDTDLYVSVHEVTAQGTSILLATDALRARYRLGDRVPLLIDTLEPQLYEFDRFTFTSREVKRGSSLRLVVAPMGRLMEVTFSERNYNSGGTVARESAHSARPVNVRLYHDDARQSVLHVPFGQSA